MATNTAGLERFELQELRPEITNALIVGIIIAKQRPRKVKLNDFKNRDASGERAVWNFTLRDSPLWYINITCWASYDLLLNLNGKFRLGDVVDIVEPQIEVRRVSSASELYRPKVTSPYSLTLNDNSALKMMKHEGNCNIYSHLLHFTTKPIAGAITIADIHNQRQRIEGVDLLGVIRLIGKVRSITTREGIEQQVREVVIFDQTSPTIKITIWEPDIIFRAGTWKAYYTVLFISDVRCDWSSFARSMGATLTSRSVVTENPTALEADNLRKYASEVSLPPCTVLDEVAYTVTDLSSIRTVMNVQQVLDKIYTIRNSVNIRAEELQFTAILYAVVTQLDLDGLGRLVITKCSRCETLISASSKTCSNIECPIGLGEQNGNPDTLFDLRLMLTDQTGSLTNCRLSGLTAEAVLNCTVEAFLAMGDEEKSILKWKLLMERCTVRIHVMCAEFRGPMITVLSCTLAAPLEVANRLPHY